MERPSPRRRNDQFARKPAPGGARRPQQEGSGSAPRKSAGPRGRNADDSEARPTRGRSTGDQDIRRRNTGDPDARAPRRPGTGDPDTRRPRAGQEGDWSSAKRSGNPRNEAGGEQRPANSRNEERAPYGKARTSRPPRPRNQDSSDRPPYRRPAGDQDRPARPRRRADHDDEYQDEAPAGPSTLNKYLAHAGLASRRDAAAIIKEGKVTVNGAVMTTPGYRVQPKDVIKLEGAVMRPQRHHVYVLLNKPKGFLTTTEDDRGRRTVMELVATASESRLFPVGRLDRNTTGVLLMTTDGDLAQKLSHPRYAARKIYHVGLDKNLTQRDFEQIATGVTLEDGVAKVDELAWLEKKNEVGLEIHSGKNRIVRRIFESLGYEVEKLDRVLYAGLTKKNVARGKWRFLTEKELVLLKHFKG